MTPSDVSPASERAMHVVVCPDSFKESLTAREVADAVARGWRQADPRATIDVVPLADGGEGTVDALVEASGGTKRTVSVTGPEGLPVEARFGLVDHGATAVIEVAAASGLEVVPASRRDPLRATSRGTGELVTAALDLGVGRVVIGLGGSATVDAGAGMLQALGARLLDDRGSPIAAGGASLGTLAHIDLDGLDPRLDGVALDVAVDVDNPLCGPEGAAAVFGPQKGADAAAVAILEAALANLATVVDRDLGADLLAIRGGGAAGGLGAVLAGVLGATLQPGIDLVMEAVGLRDRMGHADLVITGEGRMDAQSMRGKVPFGVARLAGELDVPVIAFVGSVGPGADDASTHGISAVFPIVAGPCTLEAAIRDSVANLERTARNVAAALATAR